MPFSLTANPSLSEISDAINYLLNNFGSNVSIDLQTGIIAGPSGRISNLYKYISIKYATSYDGTVGFSNVPTNATYYGIRNSNDSTESSNPADYIWYKTTGFGTTNYLWYIVAGGRQIDFFLSATSPGIYYVKDPGTAIDIDIVTTTSTQNVAIPAIYQWTSGSAPARPSTTSTYTWATASYSAPSGWTTTPSTNTTPGYVQWAIFVPITANSNTATSTIDWTNTSYPIVQFSSNGATGTTGSTGLSSLTAYLQQYQGSGVPATPSNTSGPTAPSGWSLTAPTTVTVGNVIWYTFGQYNGSSATINGIPAGQTQWSAPIAASVFQDIRSDNWNGSTPPTPGTQSTYGTTGYYISRTNGSMWLNSVYGRGIATFDGYNSAPSGYSAAIVANTSLTQNAGVEAYTNNTFLSSGALRAFNSQSGGGNAIYGYQGGTGNAVLGQSASGTGIKGTGNTGLLGSGTVGVEGDGGSGGYGVYGFNTSGSYAVYANGYYGTNNSTLVTNLYSDFAKSLVGTTANQLRFVSGTSTGSGVATFNAANKPGSSTTNVWMTVQIDSTTLYIPVWT
jgi:hypothetical protein